MTKENKLNVHAKNYFEFRKLLKLCYCMNYHFSRNYNSLLLWMGFYGTPVRGVCFNNFERKDYSMKWLDTEKVDSVSYNEFLLILHGAI
jgi:hypothetical protein